MNFFKYILAYFLPNSSMANLQDLNDAIALVTTKANDTLAASQLVVTAANQALARSQNIPGPVDYQPQINAVSAIGDTLDQANFHINQASDIANSILP